MDSSPRLHRRSLRNEPKFDNKKDAKLADKYSPERFDKATVGVKGGGKRQPYEDLQNASWPPPSAPSISLMEEQEEEEEFEVETTKDGNTVIQQSSRRIVNYGWRRSLPLEGQKQQQQQRKTQSRSRSGPRRRRRSRKSSDSDTGSTNSSDDEQNPSEALNSQNGWKFFTRLSIFEEYRNFIIAIIVAILVLVFLMFLYPLVVSVQQPNPEQHFIGFHKALRQLIIREMGNSTERRNARHDVERVLVYIADTMLRRKLTLDEGAGASEQEDGRQHFRPLTLLLASQQNRKASLMGDEYALLLQKSWLDYKIQKHSLSAEITRMELEQQVLLPLQSGESANGNNVLLLLQGIEQLYASAAPLVLHSLADPESSPLLYTRHNVLIVGTLQLASTQNNNNNATDPTIDQRKCTAMIESTLLHNWESSILTEDQIRPIISRISAHCVCI